MADLKGLFGDKEWELAQNPREVTSSACAHEPKCTQAYETDQALYLRYRSAADAEKAEGVLGEDVVRSRAIVVKFKDKSLSGDQREQIFEVVDGTHRSN